MPEDTEIVSTEIVVPAPSIEQSGIHEKSETFMASRFYACSLSHNSAILVGSSHAHQHMPHEEEHVLDAAASTFIKDINGVVIGVRQATADGLGGSLDDPKENQSIAKVAEFSCKQFVRSTTTARDAYHAIAIESPEQSLNLVVNQKYESHCAMAAASFTYSGKGTYHGELSNMGDTMILVLDKDFNIKALHPARQIYRGFGMWTPPSVQMMTRSKMKHHFNSFELDASEGDLIISMTDGIWGELPFFTKIGEDVREHSIDVTKLDTVSNRKPHFPIHTCSLEILTQALDNSLKKRAGLFNLVKELSALSFIKEPHTATEVLKHLEDSGKKELADQLYQVLFVGNGGDGVIYFKGVDIPFSMVMTDLQNRTAGDCSTINMVRLPFHMDELIRAFINHPENRGQILKELLPSLNSPEKLQEAISRLKLEVILEEPKMLLKHLETKPVFSPHMLNDLHILLQHIAKAHVLLRNGDYKSKIIAVTEYMETIKNPIRDHLFDLIKQELVPPQSFLDYFFDEKRVLFRNFSLTFGPGRPFTAATYSAIQDEFEDSWDLNI
jgi:hypothetical protein